MLLCISCVMEELSAVVDNSVSASSVIKDDDSPSKKKQKFSEYEKKKEQKLEHRLGGILCCAVCLDLPPAAIYQCTNGHLMCAGCFTHLLADARLRDETPTCPNCRTVISKELCSRNLAVEKAVSELPAECKYCSQELPRSQLDHHEAETCEDRPTNCRYSKIGCQWLGPYHEHLAHEQVCAHPSKRGEDVMQALELLEQQQKKEMQLYSQIFDLLSLEKITFNDLQFKPYRTDEFVHKLYYETSRFVAFNNQWVVKAYVNDNQKDPTQSCERTLSYQVVLKSKPISFVNAHYVLLKGPFGDIKVRPCLYQFEFSDANPESYHQLLSLQDSSECNKLLAAKVINFRLIMFCVPK